MEIWGISILFLAFISLLLALFSVFIYDNSMSEKARTLAVVLAVVIDIQAIIYGITTAIIAGTREDRTPEQIEQDEQRIIDCEKADKIRYSDYCYTTDGFKERTNR